MGKRQTHRLAYTGTALILCMGLMTAGSSIVTAGAATKTPGVTAKQVTIGATVPLTGIAAQGYDEVAKAANAVFKYVNAKGGVNGRRSSTSSRTTATAPPVLVAPASSTVAQTRAPARSAGLCHVGSLGTPTQDSVRSLLKSNGVPQLFVNSGSLDWNKPHCLPGLFGWQTSYNEESKISPKYINRDVSHGERLLLGQEDDFGTDGLAGLVAGGVSPRTRLSTASTPW